MFELKPISHESVAGALAKVERYRLLNEPEEAESICRDILKIEPDNQAAVIDLILALTDQIRHDPRVINEALSAVQILQSAYDRAYYAGIAWERRAKARHEMASPDSRHDVYEWMERAMSFFEEAERLRPSGNDEALLRWNGCVRFLCRNKELAPRAAEAPAAILSE